MPRRICGHSRCRFGGRQLCSLSDCLHGGPPVLSRSTWGLPPPQARAKLGSRAWTPRSRQSCLLCMHALLGLEVSRKSEVRPETCLPRAQARFAHNGLVGGWRFLPAPPWRCRALAGPRSVRIEDRLIGADGLADGVQFRACWLVGVSRRRQTAELQQAGHQQEAGLDCGEIGGADLEVCRSAKPMGAPRPAMATGMPLNAALSISL